MPAVGVLVGLGVLVAVGVVVAVTVAGAALPEFAVTVAPPTRIELVLSTSCACPLLSVKTALPPLASLSPPVPVPRLKKTGTFATGFPASSRTVAVIRDVRPWCAARDGGW